MRQTAERHAGKAELFGHPKGLTVLFATEMWERFSYYGMAALLVLYLVKYLLLPGRVEAVIGYQAVKGALESIFGPLAPQPLASQIFGFYAGFAYLLPILGGYLADRFFGQRAMAIAGALLMAAGHFLMAVESMLFVALGLLVLGMGAFKPNVSTQVGALYAPNDPRRVPAYSIYYVGINIGAFLAPLVAGTLGGEVGWHYGFGAAGVGMLISLAIYLAGLRHLPPDERPRSSEPAIGGAAVRSPRAASDWRVAGGLPARPGCSGRATSSRAIRWCSGPRISRTGASISGSGKATSRRPGFSRSTR